MTGLRQRGPVKHAVDPTLLYAPPSLLGILPSSRRRAGADWNDHSAGWLASHLSCGVEPGGELCFSRDRRLRRRFGDTHRFSNSCATRGKILANMGNSASTNRNSRPHRKVGGSCLASRGLRLCGDLLELSDDTNTGARNLAAPTAAKALRNRSVMVGPSRPLDIASAPITPGHRATAQNRATPHHRIAASEVAKRLLTAIAVLPRRRVGLTGARPRFPVKPVARRTGMGIRHG